MKQKFATYPIGYFHIDIAEVQTEDGKLSMFVAVDRASKFAYAELHPRATRTIAKDFRDNLTKAVPYKIHTVLTDNVLRAEGDRIGGQSFSVREHALAA